MNTPRDGIAWNERIVRKELFHAGSDEPYLVEEVPVKQIEETLAIVLAMGKGVVDVPGWRMVITLVEPHPTGTTSLICN